MFCFLSTNSINGFDLSLHNYRLPLRYTETLYRNLSLRWTHALTLYFLNVCMKIRVSPILAHLMLLHRSKNLDHPRFIKHPSSFNFFDNLLWSNCMLPDHLSRMQPVAHLLKITLQVLLHFGWQKRLTHIEFRVELGNCCSIVLLRVCSFLREISSVYLEVWRRHDILKP